MLPSVDISRKNWNLFSFLLLLFSGLGCAFFSVSCVTSVIDVGLIGPEIEGAELIGSAQCQLCHPSVHGELETAVHANVGFFNQDTGMDHRCESCHGAGSMHFATGGNIAFIKNPGKDPSICMECHLDKKMAFNLPGAHPLIEGKMSCTHCHEVHTGQAIPDRGHGMTVQDQACYGCHEQQSGPFVFEHEAMREGCQFCHDPHGSPNDKMLVTRNANLCLQCHLTELSDTTIQIGGASHSGLMQMGTCWTAGCHEAVHGSNVSPKLRF